MLSLLIPVAASLSAHAYVRAHEPQTIIGIFGLLIGPPCATTGLQAIQTDSGALFKCFVLYHAVHWACLTMSVIVYRLSPFHPLAGYPGPAVGKITRFWALYIAQSGNQHRYHRALFEQYGDTVRTGPNHLIIRDANAIPTIFGTGKDRWRKGDKYEVTSPPGTPGNLLVLTNPSEHAQRRKQWEHAFTRTALKGYEDIMQRRIAQLLQVLEENEGKALDLKTWISYFTFDFMGDLGFGSKFNMLAERGDHRGILRTITGAAKGAEVLGAIGWFKSLFSLVPIPHDVKYLWALGEQSVQERQVHAPLNKDIFFRMLNEDAQEGRRPLDSATLLAEACLVIVAGSDTTSNALTSALFYLLTHPGDFIRLREEIDHAFPDNMSSLDSAIVLELPFFRAVVNETLRLQPASPSGTQLVAAPNVHGPSIVAGRVIPPGTTIQVPTYTIHHDPRYFWPEPDAFRPQRWLVDVKEQDPSNFRLDTNAYIPFSHGPTACIGKNLALMEIRMTLVAILRRFDITLQPGWDPAGWEQDCKDCFTLVTGPLPVVLGSRSRAPKY